MKPDRPKFLNCIMTKEIIRKIRSEQEEWDKEYGEDNDEN